MHPSCASRFLPVTSSCLAFYLGQTGIRLNALIKLLTWFGRPGGHRVSADELDLFCLRLPPSPSPSVERGQEGGIDQGCTTTRRDLRGAPCSSTSRLFVPSPPPPRLPIAIRILISRSTTCPTSGYLTRLFAADLTTSRADRTSSRYNSYTHPPLFLAGYRKKTGRAGWYTRGGGGV